MSLPLMPKATAVWLVENTALTFDQIAEFCGLHVLEVQSIADGEVAQGLTGQDPLASGQLTHEEITRCEQDASASLALAGTAKQYIQTKSKGARYTPVARRGDKPDAIAWLIKQFSAMPDAQIVKLIGTTKSTIAAVRDKSHWNSQGIKPRDPVLLGLCSQMQLDAAIAPYRVQVEEPEDSEDDAA